MDWAQQQRQQHHQPPASRPSDTDSRLQQQPRPQPAAARPDDQQAPSGAYQRTLGYEWRLPGAGAGPGAIGQHQQRHPSKWVNVNNPAAAATASSRSSSFPPPAPYIGHQHHVRQHHPPNPYRSGRVSHVNLSATAGGTAAGQQQQRGIQGVAGGGGGRGRGRPNRVWISGGGDSAPATAVGQHTADRGERAGTWGQRKAKETRPNYKQAQHLQRQSKEQRKAARKGMTRPPASDACMRALGLAAVSGLIRVSEGLEGTCVELSNAAREGAAWHVRVKAARMLPVRLQRFWPRSEKQQQALLQLPPSRLIQRKLLKSVVILRNVSIGRDFMWPSGVEKVRFDNFNLNLRGTMWPSTIREIILSPNFSKPIEEIVWPKSLQVLELGREFNRPVEGVLFPDGMRRIEFSRHFDQPIAGVKWPSRLRVLKFGRHFNRPLNGVIWPDALEVLSFEGMCFDQPIHVTPLPKNLQILELGHAFDQTLDTVVWPKGLKEVDIGCSFTGKQSPRLADVVWPSGLREMKAPMVVADMGHLPKGCCRLFADDIHEDDYEIDPYSMGMDWMMWEHFMGEL